MKKTILFSLVFLVLSNLTAQNKQYTMQEAVLGLRNKLAPKDIQQTHWIPHENAFTKLVKKDNQQRLVRVSVPDMKQKTLFSLKDINQQLFQTDSLQQMPSIQWESKKLIYFNIRNTFYKGIKTKEAWQFKEWVKLPKDSKAHYINDKKLQIAYTVKNNLFVADAEGNQTAITQNSDEDIVSGQIVSRQEFGVDRGVFFSPKGNYIAFYQMDESKVSDYPIINWLTVPAKAKTIKYPMAGQESQKVSLGIYHPKSGKTLFLKVDKAYDDYLTNVTWGPREEYLYVATFKRDQEHLKLIKYDVKTGEPVKTLLKESDDKYVHPMQPLAFIPGHDNQFLWWSQRDGFLHLYRYNTKGKLLNPVTSGDWVVNSIVGWIPENKEVIIAASKLSPMDRNIYAVNWETGAMRQLDQAKGMHYARVNDAGTYWIDRFSNYHIPNKIRVASTTKDWEKVLLTAQTPLKAYEAPKIKELTITAADGKTPLYARMILPPDFNPEKKYPVIVYLYNGPSVQLLHHRFPESGNLWYAYMAQHGYIVFTMDGRGSANRGLAFEQATFRNLGTVEMKDQLEGVKYLKSLPYVDQDRLGVHGWSFGGFMTVSLMLRHPGVFQVAVAGGPVIDWRMYEVMYTERYMDTPNQNPKGYQKSSLLNKVENLQGKLMIIHGAQDPVVVWQHSMRFLHQCIQHGVQVDYFVYPAHPHNVRGKDRVHLMQKITDYFDTFLK